ncbi:cation-transporting P-type ATPase [Xanthobacter sp. KR7-225]|uniref:cation-translocating P-type ATPase n=1 Tax=Xanthobacter sp. KR7-225 TaxID=3156613 RepID=UPI0032B4F180
MPAEITCRVCHHLPSRTRLRLTGGWPKDWDAIARALAAAGAGLAKADPRTGSVLLNHPAGLGAAQVAAGMSAVLGGGRFPAAPLAPAAPSAGPGARAGATGPRIVARRGPPAAAGAAMSSDARLDAVLLMEPAQALARLGSAPAGLSGEQAARIRAVRGPNALPAPEGRSRREILLDQVSNLPVGLLAGSAVLSFATGGVFDAAVTLAVIAVNAGIGFATENSTETLIRRLSRPVGHPATVLRDGAPAVIPAREIVEGDVILLAPGTVVPADARLIAADALSVDESALTGESLPVDKTAAALAAVPGAVGERHNLVHGGTVVTGGGGRAVVVRTGADGEAARTRAMIGAARPPRPVTEEKLAALSTNLALGCLGASGLLLAASLARGEPLISAVRSAIALAVAAIPEGLPAVATTTLALGAKAMEKDRALVRSLPAIEAIGAIDTICLDKTGTLTWNEMAVARALAGPAALDVETLARAGADGDLLALCEAVALCSEAELEPRQGSATELALLDFAVAMGCDVAALRAALPLAALRNRDHRHRYMVSEHSGASDGPLLFVKGSPEDVLALCDKERVGGTERPLAPARRAALLEENERLAGDGLRVLAAARGRGAIGAAAPQGLAFLGLAGLADPVKRDAGEAIDLFHKAGIRTIMMTGDQQGTALAVARSLALSRTGVLRMASGPEIAALDQDALGTLALGTSVFARVSPADKLRIVEALQAKGRRVAMLGDGVNDGPALRAAAVGVAVGEKATAVAREVADLVLAHDDLRELARAIARGRATQDNVRNSIRFFFSTNLSEILVMLVETLHGRGEGETPMELFWLNLVTDVLPALGLALAEPRGDVMARPPNDHTAPLFDRGELASVLADGGAIAAAALTGHFLSLARSGVGPRTRTVTFTTLALAQIANAWVLRDRSPGAGEALIVSERRLEATLAGALGLLALPFLVPGLRRLLGVAPATLGDLALAGSLAGAAFAVSEGRRIVRIAPRAGAMRTA